MKDYNKQAEDFLKDTKTVMEIKYLRHGKYFNDDTETRDIYEINLTRGERKMVFTFGNSINNSGYKFRNKNTHKVYKTISIEEFNKAVKPGANRKNAMHALWFKGLLPFEIASCDELVYPVEPSPYDVLSCLTKYDPGDFSNFCAEFGYSDDSIKAEKIYHACVKENKDLCMLFNEQEMEKLREIQ